MLNNISLQILSSLVKQTASDVAHELDCYSMIPNERKGKIGSQVTPNKLE